MFIEITDPAGYGGYKLGDIIDVDEAVARAYISVGKAKESTEVARTLRTEMQTERKRTEDMLEEKFRRLEETMKNAVTSNGPPSRGMTYDKDGNVVNPADKGVDVGDGTQVRASEAAADRGHESFSEILNLIWRQKISTEPTEREWATSRLERSYGLERRKFDPENLQSRAGTESMSGGATYGYLIKPQYYGSLFEIAMEDSVLYPYAFKVPIGQSLELRWPVLDQYFTPTSGQSASYGGVQVYRKGEIAQRPSTDAKLREQTFKVTDLVGYTPLSRDLIADNYIAADAIIQRVFARAIEWKKDYEVLNGNGVGKPLGYFNSPALLTVTRVAASRIKYDDLVAMLAAYHQSGLGDAMWVANQTTWTDLAAIKDNAGAYVFQPNAMINQAMMLSIMGKTQTVPDLKYKAMGTLLGLPIRFTEKVPALGTTGCLSLINPTQYGVADRQGLEVGISEHFLFDTDQIAFRFKIRNDGQPLWLGPYVSADSANTKFSPFVQLSQ